MLAGHSWCGCRPIISRYSGILSTYGTGLNRTIILRSRSCTVARCHELAQGRCLYLETFSSKLVSRISYFVYSISYLVSDFSYIAALGLRLRAKSIAWNARESKEDVACRILLTRWQLISFAVKTVRPVLCKSCDGAPLNFQKNLSEKIYYQYGSFEPTPGSY